MKGGFDMKRIFSIAFILTALVSCQKNEAPEQTPQENQPIKVTLTATIGGDDTKITYVEEDNVLKTAWEVSDKVSLIAVDIAGNIISNTICTVTETDGKTAVFYGEFINDNSIKDVWVYYPALTDGQGTESSKYQVPPPCAYNENGVIYGAYKGANYISFGITYPLQKKNNDPSDLEQYAVMAGKADLEYLEEGKINVNLYHKSYILKTTITYPDEDLTVNNLRLTFKSPGREACVGGYGWTYTYYEDKYAGNSHMTAPFMCFGDDIDGGSGTGLTLEGNTLVAYFALYACEYYDSILEDNLWTQLKVGDKVSLSSDTATGTYVLDNMEFDKDVILENGKMYRLSAILEKQD